VIFANKDSYEGYMKNWKCNGFGRYFEFSTGLIYEGEWVGNMLNDSYNSTGIGYKPKNFFIPMEERI